MIKKVAVINDLSGFGKCSLTAAIPVLSVMSVQACPMPTAVLTNQTGYENHHSVDLTEEMHHYADMWSENNASFDGIYSGYVAGKHQIDIICDFISKFRLAHTMVLVDPVMGDHGALYTTYSRETCQKVCQLAKSADIITPNLTELCIIADKDYNEITSHNNEENYLELIAEISQNAIAHDNQKIAVTGIAKGDYLYNGVFSKSDTFFSKTTNHGIGFSGTGDIFASILCASVVNGEKLNNAVEKATKFIEIVIDDTVKEPFNRNDGVNFEKFLYTLHN